MIGKKKNIWIILGIDLLAVIVTGLYSKDGTLWSSIQQADPGFLLLAALCFPAYLLMEAVAYRSLLHRFGYKTSFSRCYGYALTDFFASSVSPGGSAGQPAQFFAMKKDDILGRDIMLSLFAFNGVYHVVMLLIAGIMYAFGFTGIVTNNLPGFKVLIVYGVLIQLLLVLVFFFFIYSRETLEKTAHRLFHFLERFSVFQKFLKERDPERELKKYQEAAELLKENPGIFLVLGIHMVGLFFFYYATPYFVYRALGFQEMSFITIWALQSVTVLALESIPLPGGVGISEISYAAVYNIPAPGSGVVMMILSRGLSFYTGLILGGLYYTFNTCREPDREKLLQKFVRKKVYQ